MTAFEPSFFHWSMDAFVLSFNYTKRLQRGVNLDYHYNFFDPIVMKDYLDGVLMNRDMNAHIRRDTEFTGEDHILTLSTCVWHRPELRWLIQAVKIGEESLENT